jgi:hypothetical protein
LVFWDFLRLQTQDFPGINKMTFLIQSVLAGIVGTVVMTLFLTVLKKMGVANADMVRALGSLLTRSYENSLKWGLILHFSAGAFFGLLYHAGVARLLQAQDTLKTVMFCTAFGIFHGAAVSLAIVVLVAEHHPLQRFRKAGFEVAAAYVIAHILFGLFTGLSLTMLH